LPAIAEPSVLGRHPGFVGYFDEFPCYSDGDFYPAASKSTTGKDYLLGTSTIASVTGVSIGYSQPMLNLGANQHSKPASQLTNRKVSEGIFAPVMSCNPRNEPTSESPRQIHLVHQNYRGACTQNENQSQFSQIDQPNQP
jgi:hypothetical protein